VSGTALLTLPDMNPAAMRPAALILAGRARDAAELREWLQMTGLLPGETHPPRRTPGGRRNRTTGYERPRGRHE
jgi:hypothetical protein